MRISYLSLYYIQFDHLQREYNKICIYFQVNKYYDLVTSFYEFGWGESFHFAQRCHSASFLHLKIEEFVVYSIMLITFFPCRWVGESLKESIKRHEHFLALQLGLKPGQKVFKFSYSIKQNKKGLYILFILCSFLILHEFLLHLF